MDSLIVTCWYDWELFGRCNSLLSIVHCGVDFFFFQAEDGIRDLVRSRGLGDVYKRQVDKFSSLKEYVFVSVVVPFPLTKPMFSHTPLPSACLLYTSDAADERSSVDLGGRRIIKKKNINHIEDRCIIYQPRI